MARLLSPTVQNLYAQLLDTLLINQLALSADGVRGAAKIKTVKGIEYLYWQFRDAKGAVRHTYLGPASDPQVQARLAQWQDNARSASEARDALKPLCAAYVGAQGMVMGKAAFSVLERLTEAGVFTKGAVLVGTYAFQALGNQRGIAWDDKNLVTQDIDVTQSGDIALVMESDPAVDIGDALQTLDADFFPVPQLDNQNPSTSLASNKIQVVVDVLAGARSTGGRPLPARDFSFSAAPVRHLGYLVNESTSQAALVTRTRAVLVRVPDPARFAIHKLFVAKESVAAFASKRDKDIRQADELLTDLLNRGDEDLIIDALHAAIPFGGLLKRVKASSKQLVLAGEALESMMSLLPAEPDAESIGDRPR